MTNPIADRETRYFAWYFDKVQRMTFKRKEQQVTQTELARRTGFSLKTIQNIENYKTKNFQVVWCCLDALLNS